MKNGMFEGARTRFFGNFSVRLKDYRKADSAGQRRIKLNNRARSAKLRIAEKK
jgi:16S rRNA (cytosine1402-N4)-methyltransferase